LPCALRERDLKLEGDYKMSGRKKIRKERVRIDDWPRAELVIAELHHLLAIFMASEKIARAAVEKEPVLADYMSVRSSEETAIARLLLSVAVSLRVIDGRSGGPITAEGAQVGRIINNIPASIDSEVWLSLRESFNKIIHAHQIEIEYTVLDRSTGFLSPEVVLLGRDQRQRVWRQP
jgi:hypothetical protein